LLPESQPYWSISPFGIDSENLDALHLVPDVGVVAVEAEEHLFVVALVDLVNNAQLFFFDLLDLVHQRQVQRVLRQFAAA